MIDIAMTTFNGEKYIDDQIISILNQTVKDFRLIICDDCSKDNTLSILKSYGEQDSRIIIYENAKNLGFKKNFEHALSLCTAEYIALCDQDDIWEPYHLEILLNEINGKSCCVGNAELMNADGVLTGKLLSDADNYYIDGDVKDKLFRILFYGNPFQGTSSVYTKTLLEKALPIPEKVEYHDAWFSACACCENGIKYNNKVITRYRIHGLNASGSHRISFFKRIKNTLKRKGYKTDRDTFCKELLIRFPDVESSIRNIIEEADGFYNQRKEGNKLFIIMMIIKNYKKIYSTNTYRLLIPRCIGVLLKG